MVLHELPTVRVEVRFVDSKGRPARGERGEVWGIIPNDRGSGRSPWVRHTTVGVGLASEINDPEPQDTADRTDWSISDQPDADGRIVFLAPKGLREVSLYTPFRRDHRLQDEATTERSASVLGRRPARECSTRTVRSPWSPIGRRP